MIFVRTAIVFILLAIAPGAALAKDTVNLQEVLKDILKATEVDGNITMIMWFPEEYWSVMAQNNKQVPAEAVRQLRDIVGPYTLLSVVRAKVEGLKGMTFENPQRIAEIVVLKDKNGREYRPIDRSKLDPALRGLLTIMAPVLEGSVGPMGKNMHFMAFQSEDGRAIVNATSEGTFSVLVGGDEYTYRLPLGSFLPPKYDPKTGEKFPGNYRFNPFTGAELEAR